MESDWRAPRILRKPEAWAEVEEPGHTKASPRHQLVDDEALFGLFTTSASATMSPHVAAGGQKVSRENAICCEKCLLLKKGARRQQSWIPWHHQGNLKLRLIISLSEGRDGTYPLPWGGICEQIPPPRNW